MARGPKPHVVAFVTTMLLIAGTATVLDPPTDADQQLITVAGVEATDEVAAPSASPGSQGQVGTPSGATASPTSPSSAAAPSDGPADGTTPSPAPGASAGTPGARPGGSTGGGTASPAGATGAQASGQGSQQAGAAPTYPEAPLYDDEDKFRGLTDTELVLCGHAALALGAAFDTSREDLNVYWEHVNERGGVLGRQVRMSWEDDAYVSDQAVRAATTCSDKDPFLILGGIGFDQIPGVRNWAEANQELYLHHIAVAPEQPYNYSFSLSPTVQLVGEQSGRYIAKHHRAAKTGVIYRGTANWKPGSDAGIAVMQAAGMDVTAYEIFQNQGVYANELNDMRLKGIEVVWIWENALNAAQIINQASEQGYYPTWVVFPFQTTIDILTEPDKHVLEGVATWSSYAPGGYGGAFPEYGFDAEIAEFEAAYAKHRPGTRPNDILWQTWVGNKILHRMLTDCGPQCNRNRFAGMMLSGYRAHELPGCQIDFGDKRSFGGHHGGFGFFSQRIFQAASGPAYETTAYCAPSLG